MKQVNAYAAPSASEALSPLTIERRDPCATDVELEILYCGVCHSDIHMAHNDWGMSLYPLVPGHEIIGRVTRTGDSVSRFKPGDLVGVGCMVDSCRQCEACEESVEQFCPSMIMTYASPDKKHGGVTHGGYSKSIVVDQDFVLRVPENLDVKAVAPLLCAGITTYSPLKEWNVKAGDTVGVIGLGGLGHMGVKFAKALGAKVVMVTRSVSKGEDAKALGADEVLLSTDEAQMAAYAGKFDLLLNTIPVQHDVNPYVNLLKRDATMVMVGVIGNVDEVNFGPLVFGRKRLAGSLIGGIKQTQEMLDFCGEHNIVPDVEVVAMENINDAFERTIKGDVRYRFVIDMASL